MAQVFGDQESLSSSEIASEINRLGLYTRGDGQPVPASQISARANNYPNLFVRTGGKIRLVGAIECIPSFPNKPLPQPFRRQVSPLSALHDVKFWDLGRVGDLINRGLPNDSRLNHCGVYKLAVPPGYVPRYIHPDEARTAKNVIIPWDVERLESKWVFKTDIVYIGLAGRSAPRSLRKRLDDLLKHASGLTTDRGPHRGGEIVWQLRDYHEFHLWAAQTDDPPIPREIEETLLRQFVEAHGTLPFANRQS
jgi:hypothetical protein